MLALSYRLLACAYCTAAGLVWNRGWGTILMCSPTSTSEFMLRDADDADAWRLCPASSE